MNKNDQPEGAAVPPPPEAGPETLVASGSTDDPRVETAVPARLGGYSIERELGRGGMGIVYLGHDPRLSRRVAIKVLSRELVRHTEFRLRFEQEARLLAAINHPNVVTIHALEAVDGEVLFAIELLEGAGLDARLAQGRMGVEEALRIGSEIAAGLAAAHARGVIHRDLKPGNVKASADGTWKVLDFGLALSTREAEHNGAARSGQIAGTPGYMSPEQLRGAELDAATDTWALGCLLFECLSGSKAFEGANPIEQARAILERDPEWRALPADLPTSLVALLRSLLDKDPATRLGTAAEARARLQAIREELTPAGAPTPHGPRPATPPTLPAERDEFVGRVEELAELSRRLFEGQRLITVHGMGGTGKTRFVTRYCWDHLGDWPGGIHFCDLSEVRDLTGIASAVATALGVTLDKGDPIVQLGHSIAGRGRCLVILDNFEQVKELADSTLGRWLARAADTTFLVTSRETLAISGEQVMALSPLPPDGAGVELFVLRARARAQDFSLTAANAGPVREIVTLLDGVPLAIELAAARMRVLSPPQLLARLEDRFRILVGARGVHARQATLRAAIDWSWTLLAPWEQAALAQASVFAGGFTLPAAEAVLDLSGWSDAPSAMDVVQSLVDKSLLRTWTPGGAARLEIGEPYFGMYVSIQEYAAEKLRTEGSRPAGAKDGGEESATVERHGRYFAGFGSVESIATLDLHGGVERRHALALELENLTAACRRALSRGHGEVAAATFEAVWAVLGTSGPFPPAALLGAQVLALGGVDSLTRARTASSLARAHLSSGQVTVLPDLLTESLAIFRAHDDRRGEGVVLNLFGVYLKQTGKLEEATRHHEEALSCLRAAAGRIDESMVLGNLGRVLAERGRMDEALRCYLDALAITREIGNRRVEAQTLGSLGNLYQDTGRIALALNHYDQAIAISREVGNRLQEALVLNNLGTLHRSQGRTAEALRCYEASLVLCRTVGSRGMEGHLLGSLGNAYAAMEEQDQAITHLEQAISIQREIGDRVSEARYLGILATVEGHWGRNQDALRHHQEALELNREVGSRQGEAVNLVNLAALHLEVGPLEAAREYAEQSLALGREIGSPRAQGGGLHVLGLVHTESGNHDESLRQSGLALEIAVQMGNAREEGLLLGNMALALSRLGRFEEARESLDRGEARLREVDHLFGVGVLLCRRGHCELLAGNRTGAHEQLAKAEEVADAIAASADTGLRLDIAKLHAAIEAPGAPASRAD